MATPRFSSVVTGCITRESSTGGKFEGCGNRWKVPVGLKLFSRVWNGVLNLDSAYYRGSRSILLPSKCHVSNEPAVSTCPASGQPLGSCRTGTLSKIVLLHLPCLVTKKKLHQILPLCESPSLLGRHRQASLRKETRHLLHGRISMGHVVGHSIGKGYYWTPLRKWSPVASLSFIVISAETHTWQASLNRDESPSRNYSPQDTH